MENLDINFINDYIKNEEDIKNCTFDSINGIIDNSNEISDIDIGIKTDTLYDLIQAGLVEKVEE